MTDLTGAETLLLEVLGLPFLAFVLNAEPDAISRRLHDGTPLSPEQESCVAGLVAFLGSLPREDPFSLQHSLGRLGNHDAALGSSWPIAARVQAGGNADTPARSDALGSALVALARDVYPLFLLPGEDDGIPWRGPEISSPLFRHPEREGFDAAVMADPSLAKLFPKESEASGRHGTVFRSTGSGGGIQLWTFADTLIRGSWGLACQLQTPPSLRQFGESVLATLDFARAAVDGESLSVTALIGVAGLLLPDDKPLDLPFGRLRPATSGDDALVPSGLAGKLTTTTVDGEHVEIDYAGDLVLEIQVPYAIAISEADAMVQGWPLDPTSQTEVERHLETLRLALLLSWEGTPRPIASGTWRVFLDPLQSGMSTSWSDPRTLPSLMPTALTAAQAAAWQQWTRRVHDGRVPGTDIAVRRTLQAAAERADPTDGLVDAVIAWENLVGSSQGEPTLRVSAALAWLLGDDAETRLAVRTAVSSLYNLRSKVVHGDRVLDPIQANEKRDEATDIAIRALRELFQNRPSLLADCKDSNERSLRLILDAPDQTS